MPIHKEINHDFFKLWTPGMAYVLGFFSADGSMIKNKRGACFIYPPEYLGALPRG
jgi:hypothetical protein